MECFECESEESENVTLSFSFTDTESGLSYTISASSHKICRRCFADALLGSLSVTVPAKADDLFDEGEPVAA